MERSTQERQHLITEMSGTKDIPERVTAVPSITDGAVGVPEAKWHVAVMKRPRSEKTAAEALAKQGYEVYVATQKQMRIWSQRRRRQIDHVVIPSVVFIRCTEAERLRAAYSPYISHYMVNRADGRKIAVIPDKQIERLKFMLGQSDIPVDFVQADYKAGDKVRVIRGSLAGLEGEVLDMKSDKSELSIVIQNFGCAKLVIDTVNLELIN